MHKKKKKREFPATQHRDNASDFLFILFWTVGIAYSQLAAQKCTAQHTHNFFLCKPFR